MSTRRRFLRSAVVGGAWAACGRLGLPPVAADEVQVQPDMVRSQPEIEPLVRLLEDTPRERLLEEVAERVRRGMTYRELLAALLLAGVRNVQPRPSVGFKFHAVLVVKSLHLTSHGLAGNRTLAAAVLGARLLQGARRRSDVQRGRLDDAAGRRSGCPRRPRPRPRSSPGDGRLGRGGGRRRRRRPGSRGRPNETLRAVLSATVPATSARSATRRSSWPTCIARSK